MHILFCVNNIKFGTKCFVKVEQFVLPFIYYSVLLYKKRVIAIYNLLKEGNMTFRLRPLHEDKLHFADLSNTQILILALEASQKIKWNIEEITLREVRFYAPMGTQLDK